jgi:RNA polymerase sigma-70 factor, ECF subfamily
VDRDCGENMDNSTQKSSNIDEARRQEIDLLMMGVKKGSRRAFLNLFHLTSSKTYGILFGILRNRSEADEAHQDVYLRIWTKSHLFDPDRAHADCWISHVARHAAIDRLRSLGRRPCWEEYSAELESDAPGPEQTAILHSDLGVMARCLAQLDPTYREAVTLAYVTGASYEDLAAKFQVPMNTLKSWLRRSLRRLRVCVQGVGEDHAGD